MKNYTSNELDELFKELKEKGKVEGLFDKTPVLIGLDFALSLSIFILGLYSVSHFNFLITALLLGTAMMRSFILTHDVLHAQVFRSRKLSLFISYISSNMVLGLASSLWAHNHNVLHHTYTNVPNLDRDLRAAGGTFYGAENFPKFFHKYQQILFWIVPIFCFYDFYLKSMIRVIQRKEWIEVFFLLLHFMLPAYVIFNLGWGLGLGTMFLTHAVWGLWFGTIYSTNHFGMYTPTESEYKRMSRFESQIVTSRNIIGGQFIHWIYGGLNTQIEHHLYPKISRYKLLQAARMTKEFCVEHDIKYYEVSVRTALKEVYTYLKDHRPKCLTTCSTNEIAPSR